MQLNPDEDSLQRLKALRGEAATPATAPASQRPVPDAVPAAHDSAQDQPASTTAAPAAQVQPPEDDSDEEALGGEGQHLVAAHIMLT